MASKKPSAPSKTAALLPTLNDIPAETRAKSIALLNGVLATLSDLYLQSKQAHWNVRGPSFIALHELFDTVADSAEEDIDDIAERIVQLGGVANGTVRAAAAGSALSEFPTETAGDSPLAFATALAKQFAVAAKQVRAGIDAASGFGDADTADLLTGTSRALDKALWFLEAHNR
ncbi:MAG: DNA starvation/stationary phase protection protein Dps [Puniceicoccales bacterium]|jgi:starvation-inducible DNA-binding protein|nr:DNA starvation/stationary phase protection protein Dps [Puniceicoccales bacterium]